MLLFHFYLILIICWSVIGFFSGPTSINTNFLFANGFLAVSVYTIGIAYSAARYKRFSWIGLFNLFNISFLIVHFHYPLLARFYPSVAGNMSIWMYPETAVRASSVSLAAYAALWMGYLLTKTRRGLTPVNKAVSTLDHASLARAPYVLAAAALFLFSVIFVINPNYYLGGYYGGWDEEDIQGGLRHVLVLFNVMYYSAIILDFYRLRVQHTSLNPLEFLIHANKFVLIISSLLVLASLYTGDRGPIIRTLALYAGGWSIFFFRVRFGLFVIALVTGAMLMSFIKEYRTHERGVSLSDRMEEGRYQIQDRRWYDVPGELGGSVRVLNVAVKISEDGNFFYGLFKMNNLISAVPFSSRYATAIVGPYLRGLTTSSYMTGVILGPDSRTGVGTTIIADIYLDFGIAGCIVLMGLLGVFIAWIENRCFTSLSLYFHTIYFIYLSLAFYWCRSAYITNSKEVLWTFLIVVVFQRVFSGNLKLPTVVIRRLQAVRGRGVD